MTKTRPSPSLQPCRSLQCAGWRVPVAGAVLPLCGVTFFSLRLFFVFSYRYVAQLYHRISKIEWDYESEPGMVKGSILCGERGAPCAAGGDVGVEPLWTAVRRSPKSPEAPAVPLLGINTKKWKAGTRMGICTPVFMTALVPTAKRWEQASDRAADCWVSTLGCVHATR